MLYMLFLSTVYSVVVDYIFPIILVLGVLVFVHELGHFLAAKLFGVRVERFSIGFPPRLFGTKIGDTDYCVSAVPLGGYVKMSGMIDESLDAESYSEEPKPYEFRAKPTWQKVIIITAGVIMNFLLGIGIFWGIFWFQGEQVTPTTRAVVVEGGIADSMGLKTGDRFVEIAGKPVEHWEDVGRSFLANLGEDTPFLVERNGDRLQFVFDWEGRESKDIVRVGMGPLLPARVGKVSPDYPAADAGLQRGDAIIAIGDSSVATWQEMTGIISGSAGTPLDFTIVREGETLDVSIAPRAYHYEDENGEEQVRGLIGIAPYMAHRKLDFGASLSRGFSEAVFLGGANVRGFSRVITGVDDARDSLAGPLAIAKMVGDVAKESLVDLLRIMAMLSVVLGIVNILPIPALDGGHLIIILIEGVMKRPLPLKVKLAIQQVGMLILLLLMIFIFGNDIARLTGN